MLRNLEFETGSAYYGYSFANSLYRTKTLRSYHYSMDIKYLDSFFYLR